MELHYQIIKAVSTHIHQITSIEINIEKSTLNRTQELIHDEEHQVKQHDDSSSL